MEAKEAKADHPVLSAIESVPDHEMGQSINAGGLSGLARQGRAALEDD